MTARTNDALLIALVLLIIALGSALFGSVGVAVTGEQIAQGSGE
jgi:uncharacterized membrane protein YtjA (UPF0391 family)